MDNSQKLVRPRTTGDSDLVERFARAMFDEWPLTAMSPAIAERSGLPEGAVLTYDKVLEMGGNHDGLLRLAKGAAKLHTAIEATLSTRAAEIERWQPIETFAEPTAPSSGNGVLVADTDGTVGEAYCRKFGDEDDGWWWANTNWGDYPEPARPSPVAWQPLPEPPRQALSDTSGSAVNG